VVWVYDSPPPPRPAIFGITPLPGLILGATDSRFSYQS
jgi:hypothetical protein